MISFSEIPTSLRVPFVYVEFNNQLASSQFISQRYRTLLIGQRLASGRTSANELVRILSPEDASKAFGAGSMLHRMSIQKLKNDPYSETWAIALDDATKAVSATSSLEIIGTAQESGVIDFYIAGQLISIAVTSGQTAESIIADIINEANKNTLLSVTFTLNADKKTQIDIKAKHAGELGNALNISVNSYTKRPIPDGLKITFSPFMNGAKNPNIQSALDALGDIQYHVMACPYTDSVNLNLLANELESRSSAIRQIEGVAVTAMTTDFNDMLEKAKSMNSPYLVMLGASYSPTPAEEISASLSGVVSKYAQEDPARPFQTLPLMGVMAPDIAWRLSFNEHNQLLYNGVATTMADSENTLHIQRLITTYRYSASGADDVSYLDLNTLLTLSYIRYDFRTYFLDKYPRHKLADSSANMGAGQAVLTPTLAKAEALSRFQVWQELGLVENYEAFKQALVVERNKKDPNRLDFKLQPNLVNQLRIVGAEVQFLL